MASNLRTQYIPRWAGLGRSLYKGTWKSSTLASRFFDVSPQLIRSLPFWDVEVFAGLVESLSGKSYDVASECLVLGRNVLPQMGREREAFLSMGRALAEGSWREVKACLEISGRVLPQVEEEPEEQVPETGGTPGQGGAAGDGLLPAGGLPVPVPGRQPSPSGTSWTCARRCWLSTPRRCPHFLKSPQHGPEPNHSEPGRRVVPGGRAAAQGEPRRRSGLLQGGVQHLRAASWTPCLPARSLERIKGVMRLYCRMLSGSSIEILSSAELAHKGIGWVSESAASTEGSKVYLPPVVDRYPSKGENFGWFKVVSTHQVAHLEFHSFGFTFELPSLLFEDLRPTMEKESVAGAVQRLQEALGAGDDAASAERGFVTDMGRFFNLFDDRKLALDVFTILEDGRLDYRVKAEYAGIVRSYRQVQGDALAERPAIDEMPLLQCMVELLVRLSLEQLKAVPVAQGARQDGPGAGQDIQGGLLHVDASVEDTAEATIRVYKILSPASQRNPSRPRTSSPRTSTTRRSSPRRSSRTWWSGSNRIARAPRKARARKGTSRSTSPPSRWTFRGDFKPELVQLLNRLRMEPSQDVDGEAPADNQGDAGGAAEGQPRAGVGPGGRPASGRHGDVRSEHHEGGRSALPPPSQPGQGHGPMVHEDEQGGALEANEPKSKVYDEWDFRADDYKPKWCIVREKNVEEGDITFYNDTVRNFASLSSDIRRQFELVVPESFRQGQAGHRRRGPGPGRGHRGHHRPQAWHDAVGQDMVAPATSWSGTWRWCSSWT